MKHEKYEETGGVCLMVFSDDFQLIIPCGI